MRLARRRAWRASWRNWRQSPRGLSQWQKLLLVLAGLTLYVGLLSFAVAVAITTVLHPPSAHAAAPDVEPVSVIVISDVHRFTPEDVMLAMALHSPKVRCVIDREVGGVGYEPYTISIWSDLGPGQLNPKGKLPRFLAQGYTNPFDPYQVADFMETEIPLDPGAWSPVRLGMC